MGPKTQPHVQSSWALDQTTARIRTVAITIMTTLSLSLLVLSL